MSRRRNSVRHQVHRELAAAHRRTSRGDGPAVAALAAFAVAGGYTGARGDVRALKGWYAKLGSANSDTIGDLETLRRRSSDMRRNNPLATGGLSTIVTSVVGSGIRPQPRIDRELLGLTEEAASAWEGQAARLWSWWAETPACDVAGRLDFYAMQALVLMASLERGDVLAVRRYKSGPQRALGLAIQLFEADYLCNPHLGPDTVNRVAGIEYNDWGEPTKFWLASRHPSEHLSSVPLSWSAIPAVSEESGERLVLHIFDALRPNQSRGVPILAPVIEPLRQLGVYTNAELMAAVLSSFLTIFVKQENTTNPTGLAVPLGTTEADKESEYNLGQGSIIDLAAGESIETVNPARPNDKFDPFVLAVLRQVGIALELPYELLIKHFSASYSASRAAMVEAWRAFMRRRRTLVSSFCQPSYDWMIAEAVAAGRLEAPGFFADPLIRRAWTDCAWTGDAPSQIDEESAVQAAVLRISAGLSTLEEETAKLTGGDWEQNHAQQVKERKARVAAGLDKEPVAERIVTEPVEPEPADGEEPSDRTPEPTSDPAEERPPRRSRAAAARLEALAT